MRFDAPSLRPLARGDQRRYAQPMSENQIPPGDRIAKVLSRAGVASRREAERLIADGKVSVNGKIIESPALNVTDKDKITVNGKPVKEPDAERIWLYHKPAGLVTTERDEKGRDTVFDALPETMPRVMSVGRLDLNSEGLLLLTNDSPASGAGARIAMAGVYGRTVRKSCRAWVNFANLATRSFWVVTRRKTTSL